jgi:hypothetical protein
MAGMSFLILIATRVTLIDWLKTAEAEAAVSKKMSKRSGCAAGMVSYHIQDITISKQTYVCTRLCTSSCRSTAVTTHGLGPSPAALSAALTSSHAESAPL